MLEEKLANLEKLHQAAEQYVQDSTAEKQELETIAAQLQEQIEEVCFFLIFFFQEKRLLLLLT